MPAGLSYPDLVPPSGWSHFPHGPQVRLIPPGSTQDTAMAAIIISPLLPRSPRLPTPEQLIELTLQAEEKAFVRILEKQGPIPVQSDTGLQGVCYEVRTERRAAPEGLAPLRERRIYLLYADPLCYYGINYLAEESHYEASLQSFWQVARSIRPFEGRIAAAPSGTTGPYGVDGLYED